MQELYERSRNSHHGGSERMKFEPEILERWGDGKPKVIRNRPTTGITGRVFMCPCGHQSRGSWAGLVDHGKDCPEFQKHIDSKGVILLEEVSA